MQLVLKAEAFLILFGETLQKRIDNDAAMMDQERSTQQHVDPTWQISLHVPEAHFGSIRPSANFKRQFDAACQLQSFTTGVVDIQGFISEDGALKLGELACGDEAFVCSGIHFSFELDRGPIFCTNVNGDEAKSAAFLHSFESVKLNSRGYCGCHNSGFGERTLKSGESSASP